MQIFKTLGFCFVVVGGLAVVYASPAEKTSVPADYLVRSIDAADAALKPSEVVTLSDWEFTARGRPATCRFVQ
jgi:hypothetical protein